MSVSISFIPLASSHLRQFQQCKKAGIVLCHTRECYSKGMLCLSGGTAGKHRRAESSPGAGMWGSVHIRHRQAVTEAQRPSLAVSRWHSARRCSEQGWAQPALPLLPWSPSPSPGSAPGASRAGPAPCQCPAPLPAWAHQTQPSPGSTHSLENLY